ncbi:hypothetical protein [Desulfoluna spongiiphila]|uniref:Uncharacterized protein n=1 Tax=Desulfoluna spongiiphila TaxID=419481 RepID=A0A1G5F4W8_9BACT|nr:hypothetical protein [Desulfoluna spongiiphila]SCY33940.1 hypothetical protein SAMN05216233_107122 [Desulfoluna spongiiphila]
MPIRMKSNKSLDPTYETRGLDAAMLSQEVSASSELELTARTDEDHRHVDSQVRLTHYRNGWDLAFLYTRYTDTRDGTYPSP